MKKIININGIYKLTDSAKAALSGSKYFNDDLAPTLDNQRNWTAYNIAACWLGAWMVIIICGEE